MCQSYKYGGDRRLGAKTVRIGGESALPFLFDEGDMPNAPVVALEILDCEPGRLGR